MNNEILNFQVKFKIKRNNLLSVRWDVIYNGSRELYLEASNLAPFKVKNIDITHRFIQFNYFNNQLLWKITP